MTVTRRPDHREGYQAGLRGDDSELDTAREAAADGYSSAARYLIGYAEGDRERRRRAS